MKSRVVLAVLVVLALAYLIARPHVAAGYRLSGADIKKGSLGEKLWFNSESTCWQLVGEANKAGAGPIACTPEYRFQWGW